MHLTGPQHASQAGPSTFRISRRKFVAAASLLPVALFAAACGDDADNETTEASATGTTEPPQKLTFMAGFKPQANLPFVGVYVAQEKGFFKEQNLEVEIRHAQSGEHLQLLLNNTVQIATANAAQVLQRNAEGLPLIALALVGQRSEQGFIVGANSGITSIKDWPGRKFGYKGSVPVEFLALARSQGIDPDKVEQVRVSFDPRVLSEGQVDILACFISNEPGQLDRIGYKTKLFDPSEFGMPFLGLTYITNPEQVKNNPQALERFTKAALHGIEYADANRTEAVDIVMKFAPQEVREQQQFMMETELARAKNTTGFGAQSQEQWQKLADALLQYNSIPKAVDVKQVFTANIPSAILKGGKVAWP